MPIGIMPSLGGISRPGRPLISKRTRPTSPLRRTLPRALPETGKSTAASGSNSGAAPARRAGTKSSNRAATSTCIVSGWY